MKAYISIGLETLNCISLANFLTNLAYVCSWCVRTASQLLKIQRELPECWRPGRGDVQTTAEQRVRRRLGDDGRFASRATTKNQIGHGHPHAGPGRVSSPGAFLRPSRLPQGHQRLTG